MFHLLPAANVPDPSWAIRPEIFVTYSFKFKGKVNYTG